MKNVLIATVAIFGLLCYIRSLPAQAQTADDATEADIEITLANGKPGERKAKEQLQRLLHQYNLDPWIFTHRVKIDTGVNPHSTPVLTLNWAFLDDDDRTLTTFVHEQVHWFLGTERAAGWRDAMKDLRARYPNVPEGQPKAPRSEHVAYLHLIVNWLELDAMSQLIGEEKIREMMAQFRRSTWNFAKVLNDTQEIGAILAKHDLLITPEKGLVVDTTRK